MKRPYRAAVACCSDAGIVISARRARAIRGGRFRTRRTRKDGSGDHHLRQHAALLREGDHHVPAPDLPGTLAPDNQRRARKGRNVPVQLGHRLSLCTPASPPRTSRAASSRLRAVLQRAHQVVLKPGDQYTLMPDTPHWFQAGDEGAIVSEFSTRSTDDQDVFHSGSPAPRSH